MTRPYISDSGPRTNGPTAYARRNMDMRRYVSTEDVILNSSARVGRAGASMVDETGDMKVKHDTRIVAVHFLYLGQFLGFERSSGPDHVTYSTSQYQSPRGLTREAEDSQTRFGSVGSSETSDISPCCELRGSTSMTVGIKRTSNSSGHDNSGTGAYPSRSS